MAKTKIGGITVEIGADTSDLSKKLKDVNSESKKTTSELKSIDQALKQAPNSLELWKQKQEALTKVVENSKKKLEALVSEQENLKKGLADGTVTEDAYKAYQREIEITKGQIESAEKALKDFTDTEKGAGQAAKTTGDEVEDSGKKAESSSDGYTMLKNAVANLAADGFEKLVSSAKEAWGEIDEGYDTIIAKTGATGDTLNGLQEAADNVFTSIPVEMNNVGDAIGEINTRYALTGKELESLTSYFLEYSKINNTQVASSVRNVAGIMKAFQEDTANASKVLDVFTDVGQRTGKDINSLESELLSNSATFKELGLDIRQSAELLGQFEANGIDTSTAIKGLQKAQQEATADGKTMTEALGETIERIKGAKDETEALQIATDLFSKKGAAAMTQAIKEQRFSLDDLVTGYDDMRDVVSDTFEATQDAPDKAKVALNNLKLELAQLGEAILPKVEKFVSKGIDDLPKIIKFGEEMLPLIKGVGTAYATWKIASTAVKGAEAVKGLATAVKGAEGATKLLNTTMLANPAVAVTAGIAGLTVAIGALIVAMKKESKAAREEMINDMTAESRALSDSVQADIDKMNELNRTAREQTEVDLSKTYRTESLYKELQGLVDENGNVKKGYEDRVNYITTELQEATGIEIQLIDGVIQKYGELQTQIDETIKKQRAQIFEQNYADVYNEALVQNSQAASKLVQAQNQRSESQAYIDELNKRVQAMFQPGGKMQNTNITYDMVGEASLSSLEDWHKLGILNDTEYADAEGALKNIRESGDALAKERNAVQRNNYIIEQYEKAEKALANGDYSLAQGYFAGIDKASIESFNKSKDNIDELVEYYKEQINEVGDELRTAEDQNIKYGKDSASAAITEMVDKMVNDGLDGGEILKTGIINKLSQIDHFDTDALKNFMVQTGVELGDILATTSFDAMSGELRSAVTDLLYEQDKLIDRYSVNSPGDAARAMTQGWGGKHKFYATGGYIGIGQDGIIAEAGPELLQVMNGGIKITPLSRTATNTPVGAGGDTIINNYYNYVTAEVNSDYDVQRLAERLGAEERSIEEGKGR